MRSTRSLVTLLLFLQAVSATDVHFYIVDRGWAIEGNNDLGAPAADAWACISYCYSSASLKDTIKSVEFRKDTSYCQCSTTNKFEVPDSFGTDIRFDAYNRLQVVVGSLWCLQQPIRTSHIQYYTTLPGVPTGTSTHAVAIVPSTYLVPDPVPVTSVAACADLCFASAPCSAYITNPSTDGHNCTLLEDFMFIEG